MSWALSPVSCTRIIRIHISDLQGAPVARQAPRVPVAHAALLAFRRGGEGCRACMPGRVALAERTVGRPSRRSASNNRMAHGGGSVAMPTARSEFMHVVGTLSLTDRCGVFGRGSVR